MSFARAPTVSPPSASSSLAFAGARLWPLALVVALALPGPGAAQTGLEAACAAAPVGDAAECRLAVASMRVVQERVGLALWGGNPVPGTASTVGLRIGSTPRLSLSTSLALVPADLPPLPDRSRAASERALLPAVGAEAALGILPGWSPLPTVGGVLSVDAIGRFGVVPLPRGRGFREGAVAGGAAGLRLGLLRESFTLPGVSVTGVWGRSGAVAYGDPAGPTPGGFARGPVSDLGATLAVSRRISALRLTGGFAAHRYASQARVGYPSAGAGARTEAAGRLTTTRRSWFANVAWTSLIFHFSGEAGWQGTSSPEGLPPDVRLDPVGWWLRAAFRLSI